MSKYKKVESGGGGRREVESGGGGREVESGGGGRKEVESGGGGGGGGERGGGGRKEVGRGQQHLSKQFKHVDTLITMFVSIIVQATTLTIGDILTYVSVHLRLTVIISC